MKKHTDTAYIKGIFSSLLILLVLAFLTVFPNLWDNFGSDLNPIAFRTVPFLVLAVSGVIVFCLYEGISLNFYADKFKAEADSRTVLRFFLPKSFFRIVRLYAVLGFLKLLIWCASFLPVGMIFGCTFLFYKNGCPLAAVAVMSVTSAVSLTVAVRFYNEVSLLFFLSPYCFFENENESVGVILKESFERMKGKGSKIRNLRQSFFLPFLSCALLVPIPFVLTDYKNELSEKAYEIMKGR